MPSSKIRADYHNLNQIAKRFGQEAEATNKSLRNLLQAVDTLKHGDWIGEGANKFYEEFDSAILPSLKRLRGALEIAGQTTNKMEAVMREAEDLAAKLLGASGDRGGSSAGLGQDGGAEGANGTPIQQTEAEATETRLNDNDITIQSSGNCRDRNVATCTSVEGIREETVDGLIAFQEAVGVDLVMTGGTEVGHAAGEFSHGNGYKVDISLDPTVDSYIEDNFTHTGQRSDGAELYEDADGNVYAHEGNHWDITYN